MIKLLWIACSIPVFVYSLKYLIKDELEVYGAVDSGILFLMALISFFAALFGPLAILGYIGYNIVEGIAEGINERHQNSNR